ncbi:recombinase family protein [Burkholderia ubonensis]|uniref:recombinase family protein n=1 Tax=Burkholderia ubonensis TaxID=101571 RepID=UPI000ADA02D7|nr:recombinase family protein [Burkholderia ubonensis]
MFDGRLPATIGYPAELHKWRPESASIFQCVTIADFRRRIRNPYVDWLRTVSIDVQHLELQRDVLAKASCERVFEDTASGAKAERTGLTALLATLRRSDIVAIW